MKNVPQRQAYGMALAEYGDVNADVVVLDADVSSSTLTAYFAQRHPTRFFNLGVTEASMVDVGVGFALGGMIPFVNTFAALLTLRACEQIRTCVAYANTNLKLVGGYAGLSDYKDGPTHFAVNDMALMRAMPNMAVVAPADNVETARMVRAIAEALALHHPTPIEYVGLADTFAETGPDTETLMDTWGLAVDDVGTGRR
jgi:transketolase